MRWVVRPSALHGSIRVPGDKSIAHRALILAALADGASRLDSIPLGEDILSTAGCMRLLGARVAIEGDTALVSADGLLSAPGRDLDAGNSGTTMRLLAGVLAGQQFTSVLTGDSSLRRRPMARAIAPLTKMGAHIASADGRAPLTIAGTFLRGIAYRLPVASAQVKSAVLLAGLFAAGETSVTEDVPARDHTERMLSAAGVDVRRQNGTVSVRGGRLPAPLRLAVPGDLSAAAFFQAGAALTGGEVTIFDLGVNPTRTGFLHCLERMGVTVEVREERSEMGEPRATVRTSGQVNRPVEIEAEDVPALIDELPLVALLASQTRGRSVIRGAAELRVKETDRIAAVVGALRSLGADIEELPDGFVIHGPSPIQGTTVDTGGDHRLAMMLALAGAVAGGETTVEGAECAAVSYPDFARDFAALGGSIEPQ